MEKQRIAVLGSTGSIGIQTLEIIESYPNLFEIDTLTSNNNWELLADQAIKFSVNNVVIACEQHYLPLKNRLKEYDIKVFASSKAIDQVVENQNIDCVVVAIVGYAGLSPTISAIKSHKKIALANKETLVVAGNIVMDMARKEGVSIIPVDSEHSAIFQCLMGEQSPIEKIILTASGGPFYGYSINDLERVSVKEALKHPNWSMGSKISIDSATMMNKGLEVIEAKWLFDVQPSKIDVVIDRNSTVHSMVQFEDGAIKAQMGSATMKQPIQFALTYPHRIHLNNQRLNLSNLNISFKPVDRATFSCLDLAYKALEMAGNTPCVLNAANEVAVEAFLNQKIGFLSIQNLVSKAIDTMEYVKNPSFDDYCLTNSATREYVLKLIK